MSVMSAAAEQQFCLRWHNYQSSLLASLPQLLDGDDLTDVTLSAGGFNLRAHKVVLSACSQYFKELFKMLQPMQHPVIVLPGANFTDLCALVTFMYSGEVNIYQDQLQGLLNMANAMQIRGLGEVNGKHEPSPSETNSKLSHIPSKRQKLSSESNQMETTDKARSQRNELESSKRSEIDFSPIARHLKPYKPQNRNEKDSLTKVDRNKGEPSSGLRRNVPIKATPPPLPMDNCELLNKMDELAQLAGGTPLPPPPQPQPPKSVDDPSLRIKSEPLAAFDAGHDPGYAPEEHDLIPSSLVATTAKDLNSPTSCDSASSPATGNIYSVDPTAADRMQLSQGFCYNNIDPSGTGSSCVWVPPSRQSVSCPLCGKHITQKRNLGQHLRKHKTASSAATITFHL